MILCDEGYIKYTGGCEVYGEAKISFTLGKECISVHIDNKNVFYDDESVPLSAFTVDPPQEMIAEFLKKLREILDSPVDSSEEFISTQNAVVSVHLPFDDKTISETLEENQGDSNIDELTTLIHKFVKKCDDLRSKMLSSGLEARDSTAQGNALGNNVPPPQALKGRHKKQDSNMDISQNSDEQNNAVEKATDDDPMENKTSAFLGEKDNWKNAKIELLNVHGLYGGINVYISGSGKSLIQEVEKEKTDTGGLRECTYEFKLAEEVLQNLFDLIVKNDFIALKIEDRMGIPDETRITVVLTNADGESHEIGVWKQHNMMPNTYLQSPRKYFDDIVLKLRHIGNDPENKHNAIYKGVYDTNNWQRYTFF